MRRLWLSLCVFIVLTGCASTPKGSPAPALVTSQAQQVEIVAAATTAQDSADTAQVQASNLQEILSDSTAPAAAQEAAGRLVESTTQTATALKIVTQKVQEQTTTIAVAQEQTAQAQAAQITAEKSQAKTEVKAAHKDAWIVGLGVSLVSIILGIGFIAFLVIWLKRKKVILF